MAKLPCPINIAPPAGDAQDNAPRKDQFWWQDEPVNKNAADSADDTQSHLVKGLADYRAAEEAKRDAEKIRAQRTSGAPYIRKAKPSEVQLEVAMATDTTTLLEYLFDPFLPRKQVIGFYGRGGTAKSSLLATFAAQISDRACTLWISTEEVNDWIKVRHMKSGGEEATLFIVKAVVTQKDESGRAIASDFNVYEHLEAAIQRAKDTADAIHDGRCPLRLVVLDTAVALTTWGKGESPNDDRSVKRLMACLKGLAEQYDLTIAVIGHSNKGKHEQVTDMVAGSAAWTNSPRQAFVHLRDQRGKDQFVIVAAKHSLTGPFVAEYTTTPVHTLATRRDGHDSVLCRVDLSPIGWGHDATQELVNAALGKDEEQDSTSASPKQAAIGRIVATVLELLNTSQPVSREDVCAKLGSTPHRRYWRDADNALAVAHGVLATRGERGKLLYQRK